MYKFYDFLRLLGQVDKVRDPQMVKLEAQKREDVVCLSALSGDGLDEFCCAVQEKLKVPSLLQRLYP